MVSVRKILLLIPVLFFIARGGWCMHDVLFTFDNGDIIKRIDDTVIVDFAGKRNVLSSSVFNGGWREDLKAVFNHHPQPEAQAMTLEAYRDNISRVASELGYSPAHITAMGTGVTMENVVLKSEIYDDLQVLVAVTAGAEGNAGRAGDKALYPGKENKILSNGTINIIVYFNADVLPGSMARTIMMATEAKSAALQELLLGSKFSNGLATGTGTDQIAIIACPQSDYLITDCGKHTKPGELVGRLVKAAVKEALLKWNGYDGKTMHDVRRRMARFGFTEQRLFDDYNRFYQTALSENVLRTAIIKMNMTPQIVALTSLYAHLLDQFQWDLLSEEEVAACGENILSQIAETDLDMAIHRSDTIEALAEHWEKAYLAALHKTLTASD